MVVNSMVCLLVSEFTVVLSGLSYGGVNWCLVCLCVLRVVFVWFPSPPSPGVHPMEW